MSEICLHCNQRIDNRRTLTCVICKRTAEIVRKDYPRGGSVWQRVSGDCVVEAHPHLCVTLLDTGHFDFDPTLTLYTTTQSLCARCITGLEQAMQKTVNKIKEENHE